MGTLHITHEGKVWGVFHEFIDIFLIFHLSLYISMG